MEETYEIHGQCLIVEVPEELDHHQAEQIRRLTERLNRNRRVKNLVFDFSGTSFMDSSGVGMMINRYREMAPLGGCVAAAGVCPNVEKLFYVSGLHKIIRFYPNVKTAVMELKEE